MLYKQWMGEWLELYVKVSTKERTYARYRGRAERYILPALGEYEVGGLTAVELQKFSASLSAKGLAANTANGIVSVLKQSLKQAVAFGVAKKQYSDRIVRAKVREKKVVCFEKDEQKKIEGYIFEKDDPKLFGIILCLYTGLRIGELLALTWEDIDLKGGILTVSRSCHDGWENGRYKKIFDTPKTQSSERVIPVPKKLLGKLREIKRQTKCPFVVAGRTEEGAQVRAYQNTFTKLLERLGIAHKGFHSLRHTFATRALEVGMDVKTLSEILGHRDPTITLQRYAHSLLGHKTEMMNRLGRLLP